MPSLASSSVDLMVAVSCGLTLQMSLIIALSFRWRQGLVTGQVSLAWSIVLRTHELYTWPQCFYAELTKIIPSYPQILLPRALLV